ncbi:Myb-like DNA-binding domain-containing protein [Spironucleus salmonicida]|uniref:Myb-like DNA-binding domain-containing protein n=1 Tax=Spironucleus salmonicida TaxID=348837 RepID=V6LF08_9EUKA|nr:Myb-like DNA-binding domain-containing protein [Spironucleus salmonicida]|eukprot:EST43120.1 Myb-like DNA-binding domain-containing protein [Spironucleus salmonicida]
MFSHCSDSEQLAQPQAHSEELSQSSQINDYHNPKTPGKSQYNIFSQQESLLLKSIINSSNINQQLLNWVKITNKFNSVSKRQRQKVSLYQHYQRVLNVQHCKVWLKEDDAQLINAVNSTPARQWRKIGLKINRTSNEVIKRLKQLKYSTDALDQNKFP